jgi:pimeloyl-ACP methyl ester carboxylesterase
VHLNTIRHGDAYPVEFVLVHGLASSARLWDAVGSALAARCHGSLAVDLRGHGESPQPDDGYDFDSVTGDLLRLLAGRPVVVGQSYGGNVAVELAARYPAAVTAIVCIDGGVNTPSARFATLDEALVELRPPYERFEGTPLRAQEALLRRVHPDWPEMSIQGALASYEVDEDGGVRNRLRWSQHRQILTAMWQHPPSIRWPNIRIPVLLLMASKRMKQGVKAAQALLADVEVVWFEGADHDLHAQKPEEVADHLTRFLTRISAS